MRDDLGEFECRHLAAKGRERDRLKKSRRSGGCHTGGSSLGAANGVVGSGMSFQPKAEGWTFNCLSDAKLIIVRD